VQDILETLTAHGIRFSFNTDGPEMLCRSLREEIDHLIDEGVITLQQAVEANQWAFDAAFVKAPGARTPVTTPVLPSTAGHAL